MLRYIKQKKKVKCAMKEKTEYKSPSVSIFNAADLILTSGDDNILEWVPANVTVSNEEYYNLD